MGTPDEEEPMQRPNGGEEKILVSVRLRPLNEKEITRNDVSDWECINDNTVMYRNSLSVSERSMYPVAYSFDRVFGPDCSTRQVYEEGAKEVALSVVSGINSSMFAYGQTSSGKTYTMSGITEYTVADIYDYIEMHKEREFILKFSAMEIYNESVRDLLGTDTTPLRLLDDPERGTVVERLTEETLMGWNHFKELLSVCEAQRQIGETNLNEASSRSHQILRLTIESSAREFLGKDKSSILTATVNFVDLAGSERASQSLSAGMRLKEGCHINRSLLTLGTVIRKLSKGRSGHVPFRDSKLTRILQSSLGGNARTAIICTMSPARIHVEQSRNTLLFASCAKDVTTNAQVNVVMSDKALVKQLQRELARLECELRGVGLSSVTLDSTELLKEKDLQIEKLRKEVAELTWKLDDVRSQVENLLQAAENGRSSIIWADPDHQYPKLRVRNLCRSEKSYSSFPEDPHSLDIGLRSLDASQCSDGRSYASYEENFVTLENFEENFKQTTSSPLLSVSSAHFAGSELHGNDAEEETLENSGHYCKEVQCINVEESSTKRCANSSTLESSPDNYPSSNLLASSPNTYAYSNMLEYTPDRYPDLNTLSPDINTTGSSGLMEVKNNDRAYPEPGSPQLEEQKQLKSVHSDIIVPSPEKPSSWLMEEGSFSSRSKKMIRSRSCRARSMSNLPTNWLDKLESNESTLPYRFEKNFPGRPEGCLIKLSSLNYGVDSESLSMRGSHILADNTLKDIKMKSFENEIDVKSNNGCEPDAGTTFMTDQTVQGAKLKDKPPRNVKDVGLDPIQDDVLTVPKWPSEFKRLQRDIIELWSACKVSLVHRSYFFLLFKGDSSDSFYMEVELRRMSFLKDTFTRGHKTMVDGQTLSPASSKRALNQERQMLSREMSKRFTTEERENLFLKWGIPLNGNQRRLQLAHRLWTKTTDMDHITESATLVAKLVGFEEKEQALREMFGLLNFAPKRLSRRRTSSIWQRTVKTLL